VKRRLAVFAAFILGAALCANGVPIAAETPQNADSTRVFSSIDATGVVIAGTKRWYAEDFDELGRPALGTLWEDGKISAVTSWLYAGDSARARAQIVTTETGSDETEYDSSGRAVTSVHSDAEGTVTRTELVAYDGENRVVTKEIVSGDSRVLTTYEYGAGNSQLTRTYRNGSLSVVRVSADDENWSEQVYRDGAVLFSVECIAGERRVVQHAAK